MSGSDEKKRERLHDLLVMQTTEGLSDTDRAELYRLRLEFPQVSPKELELAAAAAELAFQQSSSEEVEPLPESVRQRVLSEAGNHLPAEVTPMGPSPAAPARGWLSAAGWYAAAAMFLIAVVLAWPERRPEPPRVLSPGEQRQELVTTADDLVQVAWARPEAAGYREVRGDVVWSNERQAGFLRLTGMPVNEPSREQYQLWIVDPGRDAEPIDGGIFDIPAGVEEVIVAIDSKLEVVRPAAFAITAEKPGGVVVSEGPLLVVAPVEG